MRQLLPAFALLSLLVACSGEADTAPTDDGGTTTVTVSTPTNAEETTVGTYTVTAATPQRLTVESDIPLWIGFDTDLPHAFVKEHLDDRVIRLEQSSGGMAVSSTGGGSTIFEPSDGTVELELTNKLEGPIEVRVYTRPKE